MYIYIYIYHIMLYIMHISLSLSLSLYIYIYIHMRRLFRRRRAKPALQRYRGCVGARQVEVARGVTPTLGVLRAHLGWRTK